MMTQMGRMEGETQGEERDACIIVTDMHCRMRNLKGQEDILKGAAAHSVFLLENSTDRESSELTIHGVMKSQI